MSKEKNRKKITKEWCQQKQLGSDEVPITYLDENNLDDTIYVDVKALPGVEVEAVRVKMTEMKTSGKASMSFAQFEQKIIMMSTGLSHQELDWIKTNKPSGVYDQIRRAVYRQNSMVMGGLEEIESEKN